MLYLHTSLYVQGTRVIFYVSLSLLHWREWSGTFLIAVRCMRLRIGLQCQIELELPFIHHATQASIQQHMLGAQKCFLNECVHVCQVASVVSDCATLWMVAPPGSSVHGDSLGKNTGIGCQALLRRIFLTQRSNPRLMSPTLAGGFFTTNATWKAL